MTRGLLQVLVSNMGVGVSKIEIRSATIDDYDAYARLMPELGVDEGPAPRDRFGSDLVVRTLVAVDGATVVGYALFEILADVGYVRNIVSDPARRRAGIGVALMAELRNRFVAAGASTWCLNVKPDNTPAVGLYTRSGMCLAYASTVLRLRHDVPLPSTDLPLAPILPVEDAEVEQQFGLLNGQLGSARAKTTRQVLALRRGDAVLGVAVFSPTVPGAFPFRVDPAVASALLARLRPLAPPSTTYLQLVVEDDARLRDALIGLGANVELEMIHMRGQLADALGALR